MVTAVCTRCGETITKLASLTETTDEHGTTIVNASIELNGETRTDSHVVTGESGGGSGGGTTPTPPSGKFRCAFCDFYETYRKVPVMGAIVTVVHFFVHMAAKLGAHI